MKDIGQQQPIRVRPSTDGFEVLDGHRRLAALREAKISEVLVHVAGPLGDADPELERLTIQIVANQQRRDLSPTEEASAYAQLKAHGLKQTEIARLAGRSEAHVSKRLSLLELPDRAFDLHDAGRIGPDSLYELTKVVDAGGDLEPILDQLAQTDVEDTAHSAEEVTHLVRRATDRAKAATELSARKKELDEAGIEVHEPAYDQFGHPKLPNDRIGYYSGVDVDYDAHLKEPCAYVCLYFQYGQVHESQHCRERRRHLADGASELKLSAKTSSSAAEKKRKAAARAKKKALTEAATGILEGRQPAKDKILDRVARLYLDAVYAEVHTRAAKWLGYDKELEGEYKGLIQLYEDASADDRRRILLAVALADGHGQSAGEWSSVDDGHIAFLVDCGSVLPEIFEDVSMLGDAE